MVLLHNKGTTTMTTITTTSNVSSFVRSVIGLCDAKDKADTGSFALIMTHRADLEDLRGRVNYAKTVEGTSVRGVIREHFAASPEGEKMIQRYADLVELKSGVSITQRGEKLALKRRLENVNTMLTKTVDTLSVVISLEEQGFDVRFAKVANTGAVACRVKGSADQDHALFSASTFLKLAGKSFVNLDSYAGVQELAKTAKAGKPNENKGNVEAVAPAKVSSVVESVDTAIAGFDIGQKDCGLSPGAVKKLALLWARLEMTLSDAQKEEALGIFNDEGTDDETAAA